MTRRGTTTQERDARVLGLHLAAARRDDANVIDPGTGVLMTAAVLVVTGVLMLGVAFRGPS